MKNTNETQTRDRLIKAMGRQNPVTISYVKADGQRVLRTIEIYDVPEELTKGGKQIIRALDRETGLTRSWRLDRIVEFVIHRSRYLVQRCPEHNQGMDHCMHLPHTDAPEPEASGYWCDEHELHSDDCHDWMHRANIYVVI